jgi:hypothetical protein
LLQKSAYRRRGTAGAFFETIDCHPLDWAGDQLGKPTEVLRNRCQRELELGTAPHAGK